MLAGVSETIRFCFLKIFKPKESKISLQTETFHSVLHILKRMDGKDVKALIVQEDKQLGTDLRMITTELSGAKDKRRQIKNVFNDRKGQSASCLVGCGLRS